MSYPLSTRTLPLLLVSALLTACVGGVEENGPRPITPWPTTMTTGNTSNSTIDESEDRDGDGYTLLNDCNDINALINPGAPEVCGDSIDNNCINGVDENCDASNNLTTPTNQGGPNQGTPNQGGPNFGPGPNSGPGDMGEVDMGQPANNISPNTLPGPDMRPPVEPDMRPPSPTDADGDGYSPPQDCDDNDKNISPGKFEICGDNIDNNCLNGVDENCEVSDGSDGSRCALDDDCDGFTCIASWPGGYCTMDCSFVQCSIGSACFVLGEGANAPINCLQECSGPSDCRSDYVCEFISGSSVCVPRCRDNNDCAPGATCNVSTGGCS